MITIDTSNIYLPNKTLKKLLADVRLCMKDCMECLTQKEAFVSMCEALTLELVEVNKHLDTKHDLYSRQLPLFNDQPKNFDVEDEAQTLEEMIDALIEHPFYYEVDENNPESEEPAPGDLRLQLEELLQKVWNIDGALHPIERSDLFINYSKAELANYEKRPWSQALRNIKRQMSDNSVRARLGEYYEQEYENSIKELRTLTPKVISDDNREIYHEAVGHVLWRTGHEKDAVMEDLHEVLSSVKTAEHFSKLANHDFVYVDREIGEHEIDEHGATPEEIKEERIQSKLEAVKQISLDWMVMRMGFSSQHFKPVLTEAWIRKMLTEAFEKKELRDELIQKFSKVSRRKTMYQILGELMDVRGLMKDDVDAASLADFYTEKLHRLDSGKATIKTTIANYIRLGITDAESLKKWVDEYALPE